MRSLTRFLATAILVISFSGCSDLFWPRADEYLQKAKGANGVETILNLTTMLEASAKAARGGKGYDQSLNDLHNQFHALDNAFCGVTKEQAATPAYALAVTKEKELFAIFKRLRKYRSDQPQRDAHLDLFAQEVRELREVMQRVKQSRLGPRFLSLRLLRYARNDRSYIWSNLKNCEGEDFISACLVGSVP